MKLNKDLFSTNMHMVELNGKNVLVRPSQVKPTKGKKVIIGEGRPPRMIKPKCPKDSQCGRMSGANYRNAQRPPSTSSWPSIRKAVPASGGTKMGPSRIPNWTIQFL
jgi:hypothetical protein